MKFISKKSLKYPSDPDTQNNFDKIILSRIQAEASRLLIPYMLITVNRLQE